MSVGDPGQVASPRCGRRARNPPTALVAVKVDKRTLDSDVERRRFPWRRRRRSNLSGHPGIVTVHDGGVLADGRPYLVMKLCTGGSLTAWLRAENRQALNWIAQGIRIADALAVSARARRATP